jgi:hypothetical protein
MMIKSPQNMIKLSSQIQGGDYLQMVFDAKDMNHEELVERFQNFLRGIGYTICHGASVSEMSPEFEGPIETFKKGDMLTDHQSYGPLVPRLMKQHQEIFKSKTENPEEIAHKTLLLNAINMVLSNNLAASAYSEWLDWTNGQPGGS